MKSNIWFARGYSQRLNRPDVHDIRKTFFKDDYDRFVVFTLGALEADADIRTSDDPDHTLVVEREKAIWAEARRNPTGETLWVATRGNSAADRLKDSFDLRLAWAALSLKIPSPCSRPLSKKGGDNGSKV